MKLYKTPIKAETEFTSVEDAVDAFMSDPKQKQLYNQLTGLHTDDMLTWLEGVLDCAEVFDIDVEGLEYLHDEMMELGEDTALKMIKDVVNR